MRIGAIPFSSVRQVQCACSAAPTTNGETLWQSSGVVGSHKGVVAQSETVPAPSYMALQHPVEDSQVQSHVANRLDPQGSNPDSRGVSSR